MADYAALAKQAGAVRSDQPRDYAALAKQAGAVRSDNSSVAPTASGPVTPTKGAGESGEDVIRGSVNIPLSPAGERQAQELAARVAAKGGFDSVTASELTRHGVTAFNGENPTAAPKAALPSAK
jgi:hypothetical protein